MEKSALTQISMSAIANLLTSQNASNQDLVGEWMPGILVKQGRSAGLGSVLYGMFAKLRTQRALNGVYNSFERDPVRSNFYAQASGTSTATTLTFDDGNGNEVVDLLAKGTVLYNGTTSEFVRVAADPTTSLTTTPVQVIRDFNNTGVTGVAVTQGDIWSRVTEGSLEGSAPRRAAYEQPGIVTNYIQTIKSSAFLSNYYDANQIRSDMEGPRMNAINYSLEQEVNQIEKALLLGQRVSGTASQEQLTGGITWAIDAAITANSNLSTIKLNGNGTSGVTMQNFVLWLEAFMNNGSEAKLAICGDRAYSALSRYAISAQNGFRIMNSEANGKLGLAIKEFETPAGTLNLCRHPLLMKDQNYRNHMIVVDLGLVCLKVMEKLHFQQFEPTNGTDAYEGQFRTKVGLQMNYAEAFGYAYNLRQINS